MKKCKNGTLGKYKGSNYTIELKEDTKPFTVPNIHEPTLKKEFYRLIKIGVLKKFNNTPCCQLPLLLYLR